jgi:hypothetical protein
MISKTSGQTYGLRSTPGRCANHVLWRGGGCAAGRSPYIVQVEACSPASTDNNRQEAIHD